VRKSRGIIRIPVQIDGRTPVIFEAEEIDADIPLLIGNSSLKRAQAEMDMVKATLKLAGETYQLKELESGHYGLAIGRVGEEEEDLQSNSEMKQLREEMKAKESPLLSGGETLKLLVTEAMNQEDSKLTEDQLAHLHRILGHIPPQRLYKHIQESGFRDGGEALKKLKEIQKKCVGCCYGQKRKPRAKFSLPKVDGRNQVVTLDLKECPSKSGYILYIIDSFTRYTVASFIPDKKASTVAKVVLEKWIAVMGPPRTWHKDGGSEFNNSTFEQLSRYFGIRETVTPAYSPWFNGTNERNHHTVDRMVEMIRGDSPDTSLEEALFWAVHAQNSLKSAKGFSPVQLMFGSNPAVPTLQTAGPTLLEKVSADESMANSLKVMHDARKALIMCENDDVLREALKQKIRIKPVNVKRNDWVFIKQTGKHFEGPFRVVQEDGKLVWIEKAGRCLRVNREHLALAPEEDMISDDAPKKDEVPKQVEGNPITTEVEEVHGDKPEEELVERTPVSEEADTEHFPDEIIEVPVYPPVGTIYQLEDLCLGAPVPPQEGVAEEDNQVPEMESPEPTGLENTEAAAVEDEEIHDDMDVQLGDQVLENPGEEVEENEGQVGPVPSTVPDVNDVTIRVQPKRKAAAKRSYEESHEENQDVEIQLPSKKSRVVRERACKACEMCRRKKKCPNKVTRINLFIPNEDETDEAPPTGKDLMSMFPVVIPRFRHRDSDCVEAKEAEIRKFAKYEAFEVVDKSSVKDGKILPMHWVLNEKILEDGSKKVKARLTVMGNKEEDKGIRTDSPTASKTNIRLLLMMASYKKWKITAMDVEAAFLQTEKAERDIFVYPPAEAGLPAGKIWRLLKPVYGTRDAARAFYSNLSKELEKLGCRRLDTDLATYVWYDKGEVAGMAATHVDDILAAGSDKFTKRVLEPIKKVFTFGDDKEDTFKYTGVEFDLMEDGYRVNANQALKDLRVPDLEVLEEQEEGILSEEGQSAFRSFIGQLTALNSTSRPDISFQVKDLATRQNKATKGDMRKVRALIKKLKDDQLEIQMPRLEGEVENWRLISFADASFRSLSDKVSSVGGVITFMADIRTKKCHLVEWSSHKLTRVCTSPSSAETLNITQAIGRLALLKRSIIQIMGPKAEVIPTVIATDSKNTMDLANSSTNVQDGWNAIDVAAIREALRTNNLSKIVKVSSEDQLADALTKNKPSSVVKLKEVLKTGYMRNIQIDF